MAKVVANMEAKISDEVLAKFAEGLRGAIGKGVSEIMIEVKDVRGKLIITAKPTEEPVVVGSASARVSELERSFHFIFEFELDEVKILKELLESGKCSMVPSRRGGCSLSFQKEREKNWGRTIINRLSIPLGASQVLEFSP